MAHSPGATTLSSVNKQSSSTPSWLPVAGAVGAVIGALIAGTVGLISSWYTLRKQREFTNLTLDQQRIQLFNERFTTAANNLGHTEAATRLAGVYGLAALADDWKDQRQTCIDVLCGYLRLPYQPIPENDGYKPGEREVRTSLIRIVRDHLRDQAKESWRGYIFRFHGAKFDGGDLSQITVSGGYVSFYDAEFVSGKMDFRGTIFSSGTVDFLQSKFSGGDVDFRYAEFDGGIVKFPRSVFSAGTVDFRAAKFRRSTIDFTEAAFVGGIVDLREPGENSMPPKIPDPPPAQMLLPIIASP
jgi:hypothetical protein